MSKGFTLYPSAKAFDGGFIPMINVCNAKGQRMGARCHKGAERAANKYFTKEGATCIARGIAERAARRFPGTRVAPLPAAPRDSVAMFYGLRAVARELCERADSRPAFIG